MTKAILALLLLALFAPVASAVDRFPPERVGGDVGPCHASQTFDVDNTFTTVWCRVGTTEVIYFRSGSGFAGYQCTLRILGGGPEDCRDVTSLVALP